MNLREHLLTCLSEECLEVAKDISKTLRFGESETNVENPEFPTNIERVQDELNDLFGVIEELVDSGILDSDFRDEKKIKAKREKLLRFIRYSIKIGTIQLDEKGGQ